MHYDSELIKNKIKISEGSKIKGNIPKTNFRIRGISLPQIRVCKIPNPKRPIQKNCHIVAFMDEFTHPIILRRKRRGIKPEVI